jgi:hypothetical protein
MGFSQSLSRKYALTRLQKTHHFAPGKSVISLKKRDWKNQSIGCSEST